MFVLKFVISFVLAYWLSAVVLGAVMIFIAKRMPLGRRQYFVWIFVSTLILSLFFNSIHYFNATAAILAVSIQILKVTSKDNNFSIVAPAFSLGWFLMLIVLLHLKELWK